MDALRRVELREDDGGQVVRLPSDLKLPGNEAVIRREGERVVLEPIQHQAPRAAHPANQGLVDLLATLEPIDEEIEPIEDYPPRPIEL